MIDADALFEAEQEALGRVAQMDLSLAAKLHRLAMDAEEPKEIAEHVRSYQRASRCVRQTIMLRARLRHERERHLLATTPADCRVGFRPLFRDEPPPDPDELRIDARTSHLQEAASRITAQAHPDRPRAEREEQLDRIDAWIDEEIERDEDAFGMQDLDEHVLAMCRAADLPEALARRFRDLPPAPGEDDDLEEFHGIGDHIFPPRRETG